MQASVQDRLIGLGLNYAKVGRPGDSGKS
jgi:hypothetical protein